MEQPVLLPAVARGRTQVGPGGPAAEGGVCAHPASHPMLFMPDLSHPKLVSNQFRKMIQVVNLGVAISPIGLLLPACGGEAGGRRRTLGWCRSDLSIAASLDDDTRKQRNQLKRPSVQLKPEILLCSMSKAVAFFPAAKPGLVAHNHHTQMKSSGVGWSRGHHRHRTASLGTDGINGNRWK